jgi:regulatory protein
MSRRITALSAQKRNPQRVNVFLDGEFAFGLARIVAAWLQVGQELPDERIADLLTEDDYETASQQALGLLNYRPRSAAEIRQKLERHNYRPETLDRVLERLRQAGLVNDVGFARSWVENRSEFRPRSRRALAYELRRRGLDEQTITSTLETVNEEQMAEQAALKKARQLQSLNWKDFRQKMFSFLSQRGFDYEISSQVIARAWEAIHPDQSELPEEGASE